MQMRSPLANRRVVGRQGRSAHVDGGARASPFLRPGTLKSRLALGSAGPNANSLFSGQGSESARCRPERPALAHTTVRRNRMSGPRNVPGPLSSSEDVPPRVRRRGRTADTDRAQHNRNCRTMRSPHGLKPPQHAGRVSFTETQSLGRIRNTLPKRLKMLSLTPSGTIRLVRFVDDSISRQLEPPGRTAAVRCPVAR